MHHDGQMLEYEYVYNLTLLLAASVKTIRSAEHKTTLEKRLEHYKAEEWTSYRELFQEQFMKSVTMYEVMQSEVIEHLHISDEIWLNTFETMQKNPQIFYRFTQMFLNIISGCGRLTEDKQT